MATPIVVGLSTYLEDFDGGQAGLRVGSYTQYATDLDTNFVTLRVTINQLITEVAAIQGPNAGLGIDILIFNDTERPSSGEPNDAAGIQDTGFIGIHSFEPALATVGVANDSVQLDPGAIVVNGTVVRTVSSVTKTGSGGAGTRFIAIDLNGTITIETLANQKAADLFSVAWSGTAFSLPFTRQNQVFFDGDEYEAMRRRPAAGASPVTLDARSFEGFHFRMEALERLVAGLTTDSLGNALGQPAIRVGSAGTPGLAVAGDPNTGIYQAALDELNFSAGGSQKFRINSAELEAFVDIHAFSGTVTHPGYTFSSDHDTGMWLPGANRLSLATGGVARAELDAEGNFDLPTNARVKGVAPAQSIPDTTPTLVDFSSPDAFDIGATAWHDHASGTLATRQEFTVPTGADGTYLIVADFDWNAPGGDNVTTVVVEITVGGTPDPSSFKRTIPVGEDVAGQLTIVRTLNAADVVRMRVTQVDTSASADALQLDAATLTIMKVA